MTDYYYDGDFDPVHIELPVGVTEVHKFDMYAIDIQVYKDEDNSTWAFCYTEKQYDMVQEILNGL